jgi:hypothetical protein
LERQFQLMEMDRASESEDHTEDEDEQQCDEKFILIWTVMCRICDVHFTAFFHSSGQNNNSLRESRSFREIALSYRL